MSARPVLKALMSKFGQTAAVMALAFGLIVSTAAQSPALAKYASLVVDAETGEVLHSVNADQKNYPASLTKIMTLYLLFDELDKGRVSLNTELPVSAHAAAQAPSKLNLRPGDTIEVEDAILALVTKSANDVAVTVGEYIGGSEPAFAEIMTRKARELGMRQTQFRNASGLPNLSQFSSARDMATLARALIHNHAKWYHYFSTKEFSYNGQTIGTHNHMMGRYPGADGIKTGFIAASGFNLVASAKRNGRRLIGVVFGGQSAAARDRHMMALLDAGFARTPGSSGVEMASMPDQSGNDDDSADEKTAAPTATVAAASAPAVMKAMAQSRAAQPAPKPVKTAAVVKRKKAEPEDAGDAEDDDSEEDDGWGIQVGAYAQKAKAQSAARTAYSKLGKLVEDGEISIASTKRRPHHSQVFRARVIGLPEDTAREACRRLARNHLSCAVITASVNVASR